jgi:hypothetical protein
LRWKLFSPGPRLNERAVHGEVLLREQRALRRLGPDLVEELPGDIAGEEALPVLGEHGCVPDRVVHRQADEPPEQQIEVELLHQQPLAPDAVERLQQQGAQQLLRRDRGTADAGVHSVEGWRQLGQDRVDHRPHRPERVVSGHALLERHVAPHLGLLPIVVAAHAHLHDRSYAHRSRTLTLARHRKSGFSASC